MGNNSEYSKKIMNEKWARERREREGVSVRVYGLTDSHER